VSNKSEIRNKSEIQMKEMFKTRSAIVVSNIWISKFEFVSDFGFRISDFPFRSVRAQQRRRHRAMVTNRLIARPRTGGWAREERRVEKEERKTISSVKGLNMSKPAAPFFFLLSPLFSLLPGSLTLQRF